MSRTERSTYDEVVAEVAKDLQLDEGELRSWFSEWINLRWPADTIPLDRRTACYAVYRLTKARSAFNMIERSRERWRNRAIELGSPPHLVAVGTESEHTPRGRSDRSPA